MILLRLATCILLLSLLASCGPPQPGSDYSYTKYPHDLDIQVNNGMMMVSWKVAGSGLISGYNIYISHEPLSGNIADAEPFNTSVFAGDTEPDDSVERFEALGLFNSVDYHVSVVVVYPDGRLSKPTKEIHAVCGMRREIELQFRYVGSQAGFSFMGNDYVASDGDANDLYFYSKDGTDYLASPSRLDGFLRNTKLRKVQSGGSLKEVERAVMVMSSLPNADRVTISEGDWVWLKTPDLGRVLINVLSLEGKRKDRRVHLFIAHNLQTKPSSI